MSIKLIVGSRNRSYVRNDLILMRAQSSNHDCPDIEEAMDEITIDLRRQRTVSIPPDYCKCVV